MPITFDEALKELENHKGTNGTNEKINTIRDYLKSTWRSRATTSLQYSQH